MLHNSFDKCRIAAPGCRLSDRVNRLGPWVRPIYTRHCHLL